MIPVICKSGWPMDINKCALLLASPYYRNQIQSNFKTVKTLNCPEICFKAVQYFNQYLEQLNIRGIEYFAEAADLLSLAQIYQIKPLEILASDRTKTIIIKRISEAKNEISLEGILKDLSEKQFLLDEEWYAKAQCDIISKLYEIKYRSSTPYYLGQDGYSIPLDALPMIERKGLIGEYLKAANCVSIPPHCDRSYISKLKMFPGDLNQFDSIAVEFPRDPTKPLSQIADMFPNSKTIYLSGIKNYFSESLVSILWNSIHQFKQKIKIVVDAKLLDNKTKELDLSDLNSRDLVKFLDNFMFTNLSAGVQLKIINHDINVFDYVIKALNHNHKDIGLKFVRHPYITIDPASNECRYYINVIEQG
jgi:hypothetical protein